MEKYKNAISIVLIIIIFCSSLSFTGCEKNANSEEQPLTTYKQKEPLLIELSELEYLFLENEKLLIDTVKLLETIPSVYSFMKTDDSIVSYKSGITDDYEVSAELYKQLLLCFDAMETKINPKFQDGYNLKIGYANTYEGPYISFNYSDGVILYVLAYSTTNDYESIGAIGIRDGWYYYDFASV